MGEKAEDKIPAQKHAKAIGPSAPEKKKQEKNEEEKKDDKKDGKSDKTDKKDDKKKEEKGCFASVTNFLSNPFNAISGVVGVGLLIYVPYRLFFSGEATDAPDAGKDSWFFSNWSFPRIFGWGASGASEGESQKPKKVIRGPTSSSTRTDQTCAKSFGNYGGIRPAIITEDF